MSEPPETTSAEPASAPPPGLAQPHDAEHATSNRPITGAGEGETEPIDLERIADDLDGVDAALRRLDDGTYWTDEVTGEPIADDVLVTDPVARRASSPSEQARR